MSSEGEPQRVTYLSYCCYFDCGFAHDIGFIDPDEAKRHMRGVHNSEREPTIKRWPHSAETYEHFGIPGPI